MITKNKISLEVYKKKNNEKTTEKAFKVFECFVCVGDEQCLVENNDFHCKFERQSYLNSHVEVEIRSTIHDILV